MISNVSTLTSVHDGDASPLTIIKQIQISTLFDRYRHGDGAQSCRTGGFRELNENDDYIQFPSLLPT